VKLRRNGGVSTQAAMSAPRDANLPLAHSAHLWRLGPLVGPGSASGLTPANASKGSALGLGLAPAQAGARIPLRSPYTIDLRPTLPDWCLGG